MYIPGIRFRFNWSKKPIRNLHSVVRPIPYGLYDKSDPNFYRTNIDLPAAANILDHPTLFWNAVKDDVVYANTHHAAECPEELTADKYLKDVWQKRTDFVRSGVLTDREEVLSVLNSILHDSAGRFVLYLGGKSTGKSTTLNDVVRRTTDAKDPLHGLPISLIDGRESSDLTELLLKVLPPDFVEKFLKPFPTLSRLWENSKKHGGALLSLIPNVGDTMKEVAQQTPTPREILSAYISKSKSTGEIPVIIIDEANRFIEDSYRDSVKHQQLKDVLELFARGTKQKHDLHVILAASEHAFPYNLNKIGSGNFAANFTDYIFAGEIPPDAMYRLLTQKWGMGDNLATAFINCYGGHLWTCSLAVAALRDRKERFQGIDVLGSDTTHGICSCLASGNEAMRKMLVGVAKDGYYPLQLNDESNAEVASKNNVVGTVNSRSTVIGVPENIRQRTRRLSGVIPTSQVTRLLIARELYFV